MMFTSARSAAGAPAIDFSPPPLSTAEWIEANYRLPATNLVAPGQLMKLTAWQRAFLDDYDDPDVHDQILKVPTQLGKTDVETGIVCSEMDRRAGNIAFAMDTKERADDWRKDRLAEAIKIHPRLCMTAGHDKQRHYAFNRRNVGFSGGSLYLMSAATLGDATSVNARLVIADEIERYTNANFIGDLIDRMTTAMGWHFIGSSTPLYQHDSVITQMYDDRDQRRWTVRHEACGHEITLDWDGVGEYSGRRGLYCVSCGREIDNEERTYMTEAGRFVPHNHDAGPGRRSYHLTAFSHPLHTLERIWDALESKELPAFKRTWMGEATQETVLEPAVADDAFTKRLYAPRIEVFTRPLIVGAVDYQGQRTGAHAHVGPNDRLEGMITEWYRSRETGEISSTGRILAMAQFPFAGGSEWTDSEDWLIDFAPWITLVDANADTAVVKEGVAGWGVKWRGLLREFDDRLGAGTYLTAGYGGPLTEEERENWNRLRVTRLSGGDIDLRLGADNLKWDTTAMLARGDITAEREGLPDNLPQELTSEILVRREHRLSRGNRPVEYRWVKKRRQPNEAWDLLNMCYAGSYYVAFRERREAQRKRNRR